MQIRFAILPFVFAFQSAFAALDPLLDAADRRDATADVLKEATASKRASDRARAARAWGRIQQPASIDPLLKLLQDKDTKVREEAAFALGQLGWLKASSDGRETEIQNALLASAKERARTVRLLAIEAFGKFGALGTPESVLPFLADSRPDIRAQAALALFRYRLVLKIRGEDKNLPELPRAVMQKLLSLSKDPHPLVRRAVAAYFARNADARGEADLKRLAADSKGEIRAFALMGLAKMQSKSAKGTFAKALKDKDLSVRVAAVSGIVALGESTSAFPFLKTDTSVFVRAGFAQGLDEKKNPADLAILNELLQDPSPTVRAEAIKSLAKNKGEGLEAWLRQMMKDPDWVIREAAVQASETLAPETRRKFLQQGLSDSDKNVRAAILEPLLAMPGEDAFGQLKKSLEAGDLVERGLAIAALKGRKESGIDELAWSTYRLSLDHKWVEARQELIDLIARNKDLKTTERLKQSLTDPDGSVRAKARAALKDRGLQDIPEGEPMPLSSSPFREEVPRTDPRIRFETTKGVFTIVAFANEAPIHVADLVGNVKKGFYDGLLWHRVVPNFVVQGGDPDGTGWGDAGYFLRAEINRKPFLRGALGMPRSQGFDTGGSQVFFTLVPTPHLEGQYTVYGQILSGFDVIDRLERGDRIKRATVVNH